LLKNGVLWRVGMKKMFAVAVVALMLGGACAELDDPVVETVDEATVTTGEESLVLGGRRRTCGGILGDVYCRSNEYCDHPDDSCTAIGVCRRRPRRVTREYMPVCGCDGENYSNESVANASGTDVDYWGACEEAPQDGEGDMCGGIAAFACGDGLVCDYSDNLQCISDMAGVCVT